MLFSFKTTIINYATKCLQVGNFKWGNDMKKLVIYVHGKGGNYKECEHYINIFKDCDVVGFDYKSDTPWEAKVEFSDYYDKISVGFDEVYLIVNSIGAYFSLHALNKKNIKKAFFISPVVDMEKLIINMMKWANVSEEQLKIQKEIPTNFGETLSWDYLTWVRENPVDWHTETHILYGSEDNLQSIESIKAFADKFNATLLVMNGGEHWFHAEKQMEFLDNWLNGIIGK